MSLELTENKSSIGSGALNDPVFILYCRVIGQWLPTRRRSVGNQSAISWGAIGNRLATGRRLVGDCILSVCFWLQKVCNFLEIGRQAIGDWSAISWRLKSLSRLSATAATGRRSVGIQSMTCRQPVGDHQKPFYDRFGRREVSLAATKTSLRPNRPCNRLQPVGDQYPTSLQSPRNLPATTWNFGRKEVADRLQAMCDRGFTDTYMHHSASEIWKKEEILSSAYWQSIFFNFTEPYLRTRFCYIHKFCTACCLYNSLSRCMFPSTPRCPTCCGMIVN